MKLDDLDFSTANNACQSLRILAEMARREELKIADISTVVNSTLPFTGALILALRPTNG